MTRRKGKGNANEKVQAATGSAAGEPSDTTPIGNPQDAAGSGAALAGGNPPAPAASLEGGGHVAGTAELAAQGETLASAGAGSAGKPDDEGLGDDQGRTNESGLAAGQAPETAAGGAAIGPGNTADPAAVDGGPDAGSAGVQNDADGSADGDAGAGNAGEASGSAGTEDPAVDAPIDLNVMAAEQAAFMVLDQLLELYELEEVKRLQALFSTDGYDVPNAISGLVRKIGRDRAMPHVVLQELVLRKHREDVPPTRAELMLARIFTTVLVELDQFEKDWQADLEAAKPKPAPEPVPLDETTLEGVDGPMDTY
ncbi:hypothetical protein [Rhizobium sp. 12,4]|uniref:hypothetical protein n=1 Tax=Rhizobium sp. 12,4 TaxID=3405135 RepID=UPI003D32DA66